MTISTVTARTWLASGNGPSREPAPRSEGMDKPTSSMKTVVTTPLMSSSRSSAARGSPPAPPGACASGASLATQPTAKAGRRTSMCTRPCVSSRRASHPPVTAAAYARVHVEVLGRRTEWSLRQMMLRSTETMTRSNVSSHLKPTRNIFKGIISRIVSRSSKMARTRAFLKSHVSLKPAASNMLKRMPALVGAAKRAMSSAGPQAMGPPGSAQWSHMATRIHGRPAADIATT
mmetsp:Transcript_7217/g.21493  ORF Transcript_7217/g.21493 Transcript_7217/m.21493 type:complete len:232 (-) Transcript_7217:216-911(-)